MKQKLIIGISGKMGSGKSTISSLLKEGFGINGAKVEIMSLAGPIYKAQDLLYKEYGLELEGDKDRDLLIAVGLWGRNRSEDFWLDQLAKDMIQSDADVIICDDVRFKNEADFFSRNGFLFRIDGEQRGDNVDPNKSESVTECALDEYDFEHRVSNTLSPEDMCKNIAIMMGGSDEQEAV